MEETKKQEETAQLGIAAVCALHEQSTPTESSINISKLQIYFIEANKWVFFFPEGVSPLCVLINAGKH
jgi:hypothetical protein